MWEQGPTFARTPRRASIARLRGRQDHHEQPRAMPDPRFLQYGLAEPWAAFSISLGSVSWWTRVCSEKMWPPLCGSESSEQVQRRSVIQLPP